MEKLSQSLEDYLKAIIILGGTTERSVRSSDIARKMEVSKTSVGKALTSLKAHGLVQQPYYGEATLTAEGFAYGKSIEKRHRYLTAFLSEGLGIPQETAVKEACSMEHTISNESFEKWAAYIEGLGLANN